MSPYAIAAFLSSMVSAGVTGYSIHIGGKWRRNIAQAVQDRHLMRRARWIMLTVVDNEGMVTCATLEQLLQDSTPEGNDKAWLSPVSTVLWYGDADKEVMYPELEEWERERG